MHILGRRILAGAVLMLVAPGMGCSKKDAAPSTAASPTAAATPTVQAGVTLTGMVIEKPWSKSTESWNAGGSEYYVLDVGGAKVEKRSAKEGVTLLASDAVTMASLKQVVGKRVTVRGVYVAAKPYTPKNPTEQYPTGMGGKPLPRGAGFRALAVTPTP